MKSVFRFPIWLPLFLCLQAVAQTNGASSSIAQTNADYRLVLVTNWVNPWDGLRTVGGQLYDINYSGLWQWVSIPAGAEVFNAQYHGSIQPTDLTFTWGGRDPKDQHTVVVYNYPYNPSDFRHADDERGVIVMAFSKTFRAFPINIQTNWTPLGKMWIGQETYDYGLPYTSLVPVATWKRVPVSEAPPQDAGTVLTAPAATTQPPPLQNPAAQQPAASAFSESLSNRLEQIMAMTSIQQRDAFLNLLAERAARDGDAGMARQSLQNITSLSVRDNAAALVARTLGRQGMRIDAFAVADTIGNPNLRSFTLQTLSQ